MAKFNFKNQLLDMEGNVTEVQLNKLLAGMLMQSNSKSPVKLFDMALTLMSDGELELDTTDKALLQETIKDSELLTVLAKGRLLQVLA
ncbi:hypothetical protein BDD43_3382 [Mucilaginibacter gracilis]|uniref:Uncharacterized protein n=1 Tax=Mucilaginibacter gracilis TaxID=423350 RepID=A0A495J2I9_9SPHI|nr:hypothetical protein [Mucilaginibacter gracilis]RKR83180.1 hypothetical protein BDD43_3382 [Mucilaginibacter gracilis]